MKKVLSKFDNKTYSERLESDDISIEVLIKIQISKVFLYLLNIRDDFLLKNSIKAFKKKFIPIAENMNIENLVSSDY